MTKRCSRPSLGMMIAILSGCASICPGTVTRDRIDYNASITESWKRQIF